MTPSPPSRASAIAMRDSVTVSIAAARMGISRVMLFVSRACVETWVGRTSLRAGMRRTSSNVRPSLVKRSPTRLKCDAVYRLALLLSGLRETLAVRGSPLGPEVEHLDALLGPRTGAPPEDARRRKRDQARAGQDHGLEIGEEVEAVRDDSERDKHQEFYLAEQDQEDERERRRTEAAPRPMREGDVQEVRHRARILEQRCAALGPDADHTDGRADRRLDTREICARRCGQVRAVGH